VIPIDRGNFINRADVEEKRSVSWSRVCVCVCVYMCVCVYVWRSNFLGKIKDTWMRRWRKIMSNRWSSRNNSYKERSNRENQSQKNSSSTISVNFGLQWLQHLRIRVRLSRNIYVECKGSKAWSQSMLDFSFSHCDLSIAIESVPVSKAASLSSVTSRKRIHEATNNSQLWTILAKLILWSAKKICGHLIYRVSVQ